MNLEELWCADCGTFVGYMNYVGPHGTVVCGPCGQRMKDEADAENGCKPVIRSGTAGNEAR